MDAFGNYDLTCFNWLNLYADLQIRFVLHRMHSLLIPLGPVRFTHVSIHQLSRHCNNSHYTSAIVGGCCADSLAGGWYHQYLQKLPHRGLQIYSDKLGESQANITLYDLGVRRPHSCGCRSQSTKHIPTHSPTHSPTHTHTHTHTQTHTHAHTHSVLPSDVIAIPARVHLLETRKQLHRQARPQNKPSGEKRRPNGIGT